jgi:cell shape-determining protein MreC
MENKHTPKLPLRISEKNECSICDSNGDFIIETFETETAKFIVTACNNYQALKEENERLTTQLAKANSDKEKLGELLKEVAPILKSYGMIGRSGHIGQILQDCGITL